MQVYPRPLADNIGKKGRKKEGGVGTSRNLSRPERKGKKVVRGGKGERGGV